MVVFFFVFLNSSFSAGVREADVDNLVIRESNARKSKRAITTFVSSLKCSDDPRDLDPLLGTSWLFSYWIDADYNEEVITFKSFANVITFPCASLDGLNQYYENVKVYYTELRQRYCNGFSAELIQGNITYHYEFTIDGYFPKGYFWWSYNDYSRPDSFLYSMTVTQLSGPIPTTSTSVRPTTTIPIPTTSTSVRPTTSTTFPETTTTTTIKTGVEVVEAILTNENPNYYECGASLPPEVINFDVTRDYEIFLYLVIDNIQAGDASKTIWYYENEVIEESPYFFSQGGDFCYYPSLLVNRQNIRCNTGNWSVEFYLNNQKLVTKTFYLQGVSCGGEGCAAEAVLLDDPESLEILRRFRDEVLARTESGRALIKLYYEKSPLIIKLIDNNAQLKERFRTILKAVMPFIRTIVNNNNNNILRDK